MRLPWFKWYPADAAMDEKYAAMNFEELGFYHACLNKAWINGGSLPSDPAMLARLMQVTPKFLETVWPMVGKCFVPFFDDPSRLISPRQYQEYSEAVEKASKRSSASLQMWSKRNPNGIQMDTKRTQSEVQSVSIRASDSVSVSVLSNNSSTFKREAALPSRPRIYTTPPKGFDLVGPIGPGDFADVADD